MTFDLKEDVIFSLWCFYHPVIMPKYPFVFLHFFLFFLCCSMGSVAPSLALVFSAKRANQSGANMTLTACYPLR
jgi:hypothetical protein